MKPNNTQPPTTEDSREGLHTHGDEWQLSKSGEVIFCGTISVATTHGHSNPKANAELICKAVNEREQLKKEYNGLIEMCGELRLKILKKDEERQRLLDRLDLVEGILNWAIGMGHIPMKEEIADSYHKWEDLRNH